MSKGKRETLAGFAILLIVLIAYLMLIAPPGKPILSAPSPTLSWSEDLAAKGGWHLVTAAIITPPPGVTRWEYYVPLAYITDRWISPAGLACGVVALQVFVVNNASYEVNVTFGEGEYSAGFQLPAGQAMERAQKIDRILAYTDSSMAKHPKDGQAKAGILPITVTGACYVEVYAIP